ncbi:MAG: hypothetical protein WCJ84_01340 [Candidatus Peregrinibacteria bacterium]
MKTCSKCQTPFEVTNEDRAFYDKISPVFNGVKYAIPEPTLCPECRQQRRLAIVNERFFYPAKCGLCEKKIITEQPPENNKVIYCRECWHSDKWDPCDYGRDFDFSKSFFEQIKDLWKTVPVQNLLTEGTNENSEYIHYAGFAKNCYLVMHTDFCEDCYYGYGFKKNTSCVDGFYNLSCELCYDCVDIHSCYGLKGCQDCINCSSSAFLKNCIGCKNCFLCVGLRNAEYYFMNQKLTKEEYESQIKTLDLKSFLIYQECASKLAKMSVSSLYKSFHGNNLENCSGDYLINCKNTQKSFDCEDIEDGKYLYQVVTGGKTLYDIYQYGANLSESYECSIAGNNAYHILFSHNAHLNCSDLAYCWFLQSSKNCFGCVNMHHKQYCILDKQYTKEEYDRLVPKIIEHMRYTGEWGEFFPSGLSPFGYNKTTAQLYYPLTEEEARAQGFLWDSSLSPMPHVLKIIDGEKLPDHADKIPDDILNWAIRCEVTGKPFIITKKELSFYRKNGLPIPRRCPDQRHIDRFIKRNPRKFWNRQCLQCKLPIETTYSPDRSEKVLCEKCYLEVVV